MTDLRELYERHEALVDEAHERLLPAVRVRVRRRRLSHRIEAAAAVLAVVATVGGVAVLTTAHRNMSTPLVPAHADQRPPAGYRIVSSLGMQVAVPNSWGLSSGCLQGASPMIALPDDGYNPFNCDQGAPAGKEFAAYEATYEDPGRLAGGSVGSVVSQTIAIDGVTATRAMAPVSGGRFIGWVYAPSRSIELIVRTNDQATLATILDSINLVEVDNAGCHTDISSGRPTPVDTSEFVDQHPVAISVCFYSTFTGDHRLIRSHRDAGASAEALVTVLNAAQSVVPSNCSAPPLVDAVLIIDRRDGSTQTVNASVSGCGVDSSLDNGRSYRVVSGAVQDEIDKARVPA